MSKDIKLGIVLKADGFGLVNEVRLSKTELKKLGRSANTAGRGLDKYEKQTKKAGQSTKKLKNGSKGLCAEFGSLKGILATVGFTAIIMGINELSAVTVRSIGLLDTLGKGARRFGLTTDELQKYQAVAEADSVSTDTFDVAFQRFARRVGQARLGTGELVKTLEILDIELVNQDGSLRSNSELFDEFGRKIASVADENVQLALTMSGVDTEGVKLIEMFRMSRHEQQRVINKVKELGGFYDSQLIAKAEVYATELGIVKKAQEALDVQTTAGLAGMALSWEKLKFQISVTKNEMLDYFGLFGVHRDDSNKVLIEGLATFKKDEAYFMKRLENATNYAQAKGFERNLITAQKAIKSIEEQIQVKIDAYKNIGNPSSDSETSDFSGIKIPPPGGSSKSKKDDSFDAHIKALEAYYKKMLGWRDQMLESMKDEGDHYLDNMDKLDELAERGWLTTEQYHLMAVSIQETFNKSADDLIDTTNRLADEAQVVEDSFKSAFKEIVKNGEIDFENLTQSIANKFIDIAVDDIFNDMFANIGSTGASSSGFDLGSVFSGVGDWIGDLFGGGKAPGGSVAAGSFYEVNERGPELLNMNGRDYLMMGGKDGFVTPMSQSSTSVSAPGGSDNNVTVIVQNNANNTETRQEHSSNGGNDIITVFIEEVKGTVASDIARGSGVVSQAIENTYGMNRAAGSFR